MSGGGRALFGVVLAGGGSRRFGANKAVAEVRGEFMVDRACRLLASRIAAVGVVANDAAVQGLIEWPVRPDVRPGLGPAGGILTGMIWAAETEASGAVILACDLPLVPGSLLDLILERFNGARPVAPASLGPSGVEPLCAAYPTSELGTVRRLLDEGPLPANRVLDALTPEVLPLDLVKTACDPWVAFLNVNREEDRRRAETLLGKEGASRGLRRGEGAAGPYPARSERSSTTPSM